MDIDDVATMRIQSNQVIDQLKLIFRLVTDKEVALE